MVTIGICRQATEPGADEKRVAVAVECYVVNVQITGGESDLRNEVTVVSFGRFARLEDVFQPP